MNQPVRGLFKERMLDSKTCAASEVIIGAIQEHNRKCDNVKDGARWSKPSHESCDGTFVHARGCFKKSASTLSNGNATQLKS